MYSIHIRCMAFKTITFLLTLEWVLSSGEICGENQERRQQQSCRRGFLYLCVCVCVLVLVCIARVMKSAFAN